jgi:hypothetical protein
MPLMVQRNAVRMAIHLGIPFAADYGRAPSAEGLY